MWGKSEVIGVAAILYGIRLVLRSHAFISRFFFHTLFHANITKMSNNDWLVELEDFALFSCLRLIVFSLFQALLISICSNTAYSKFGFECTIHSTHLTTINVTLRSITLK